VEVQFYGLLRLMMPTEVPYYAQEQIGVALLQRACVAGFKHELQSAVALARAIVFEMGSTTPWLAAEFQDLRYVITDRVVNDAPVWAAESGEWCMYLDEDGTMIIGRDADCATLPDCQTVPHCPHCADGDPAGEIWSYVVDPEVLAPTLLPTNSWWSSKRATLEPQYTSAGGIDEYDWVRVPDMRITAVHGLADAEPAMAAALRHLAALTENV